MFQTQRLLQGYRTYYRLNQFIIFTSRRGYRFAVSFCGVIIRQCELNWVIICLMFCSFSYIKYDAN